VIFEASLPTFHRRKLQVTFRMETGLRCFVTKDL